MANIGLAPGTTDNAKDPLAAYDNAKMNLEAVRDALIARLEALEQERAEIKKALGRVRKPRAKTAK